MKDAEMDWGTMEAVVNKPGGMDGVRRFLRGELTGSEPTRVWREQDGVIFLSVTSDGTTGPEWEKWFDENKCDLSSRARFLLNSADFKPTNGLTTQIAVLKGMLFKDSDRITKKIRAEAERRNLTKPNAEVACLIRRGFSNKEIEAMGLWWIVVMHDSINDADGGPDLLGVVRRDDGQWLGACCDEPGGMWLRNGGFAFAVPQVDP